jgi:hypothetical protein
MIDRLYLLSMAYRRLVNSPFAFTNMLVVFFIRHYGIKFHLSKLLKPIAEGNKTDSTSGPAVN